MDSLIDGFWSYVAGTISMFVVCTGWGLVLCGLACLDLWGLPSLLLTAIGLVILVSRAVRYKVRSFRRPSNPEWPSGEVS